MKKVLVVHYSQSGQLSDIARHFTQPLVDDENVSVVFENVCPQKPYPFPWPFFQFLDTFPNSVYLDPPTIEPLTVSADEDFDLIIIAYQVWFLSPSLPMTGFMQSSAAKKLLKDKPVVTLIGCRNMWLLAQEEMKKMIAGLGGRLVGNVALVDEAGSIGSFWATPVWVLTGKKGPHLGGLIPRAGVSEENIKRCDRFGARIVQWFDEGRELNGDLLKNLGAVQIEESLIASEKTGRRAFRLWGRLFRALGPEGARLRRCLLAVYAVFLVVLIVTVVPLNMLLNKLLAPLMRERIDAQKAYFAEPSGSASEVADEKIMRVQSTEYS
ncbi:dialkylresorcinol condensing enzyme [Aestuariicella sp. G3-2]|uniref:dialkylrecorsinol condensing enzyme n=1 Tax=Pseudomaricurvus albidus TaxID=2842452 RepID=UPI001C0E7BA1|nr:dialkylrecorsinol condensing enzyme [Aestuariicella albida]MBU3068484.1 dialkylresorcinol condensing enzyme [Aestuariicella albida]